MVIEQTVEIPQDRRLFIEVPREVPAGRTILTFTPVSVPPAPKAVQPLRSLRGISKGLDTMEAYFERKYADKTHEDSIAELAGPVGVIDTISYPVLYEAGRFKTSYSLSLADAIGLASAKELTTQLVTSDHSELEPVEQNEPISILWLPAKPKKN